MQRLLYLIISVFGVVFLQSVWADSVATEHLIRDLNANHSVQGSFRQEIGTDSNTDPIKGFGQFALQHPGKFNWTTSKQQIVADGQTIYLHDKDLKQVTISNQKTAAHSGSPVMFLIGETDKIALDYDVNETDNRDQTTYTITPKEGRQQSNVFRQLRIAFNRGAIYRMQIDDNLDGKNVIYFKDLKKNPAPELFVFRKPAGVDVIKKD